ncbi:DUF6912 family protein [Nocardioides sp.]|uniref:DUF6912 family protein n=1 Tax=Nocardioides sp. TaxID=35761 RepID=UPI003D1055F1
MSPRLYLPGTLQRLVLLRSEGRIDLAGALEAPDDSEEGEYAALMEAADASAGLVAGLEDGRRRRVVVVVEADPDARLASLQQVVAVHVDTTDDADPEDDLAWFATQEIEALLPPGI